MRTSCGWPVDLSSYLIFTSFFPTDFFDEAFEEVFFAAAFVVDGMAMLLPKIRNSLISIKRNDYSNAVCFFIFLFPFGTLLNQANCFFIAFLAKRLFNFNIYRVAIFVHFK